MKLNLERPIAFFDLETTGINIVTDRIVEIAIVKVNPDGTEEEYHSVVNPTVPIPEEVTLIHGISNDDVKDKPTFAELGNDIARFLDNCDLGGYNLAKFDVPLLLEEFYRHNIDFDMQNRHIVDAQVIFHKMEPRNLSAAYKFYCNESLENAHSALADTKATLEVLKAQITKYNDVEVEVEKGKKAVLVKNDMKTLANLLTNRNVDIMGRMVYEGNKVVFNFGKHKGKEVKVVLKYEPGYYDWMMKGEFPLSTKKVLERIKLEMLKESF